MFGAQGVGLLLRGGGGVTVEREDRRGLEVIGEGRLVVAGGFLDAAQQVVPLRKRGAFGGVGEGSFVRGLQDGLQEFFRFIVLSRIDGQARHAEVGQRGGLRVSLAELLVSGLGAFGVSGGQFGIPEHGRGALGPRRG